MRRIALLARRERIPSGCEADKEATLTEEKTMGLNERRKIKELQEQTFPQRMAELAEITGGAITYDVDWDSFADDMEALNFVDNLSCHRTNMALRVICADDLG